MRPRLVAAFFVVLAWCLVSTAPPASAHAALISSDPSDGTTLDALPDAVTFTFDSAVEDPAFVAITGPDGTSVTRGDPAVLDTTVSQSLAASTAEGTYTMAFRVTSLDGHPVSGTLTFNVGRASEVVESADIDEVETTGGDSFIREHITSLTIAMAAATLALCLAILRTARGRSRQGEP